ncbi:MAG: hypothetical protein HN926_05620 [Chloroflexi bacterium]|nr:hypothetical protein [Chloroflexota bacterium]MBT3863595.1 hypothetical protein [Chloroflexota bacterium]MBT4340495.1 hypothetical protein [Chloroflexota bacterium]MBT4944207.1 hypothetical protein [Chloroflexota bacterium]MBT5252162.1 hypothetical protein [Chloroflexota bacterium]
MVRKFLNRVISRKDLSIDAINAFVEGNASADEIQLVERLIRDDASLERDLSTQQALRSVLGRIEKIEAPRSYAVTPEMVAAAEGHDSLLSRVAELFAPQRKLALAPAAIGVIAAVGVALLTIGDATGIVDQSSSSQGESFSTAEISESADGGASSPGVAGSPGSSDSSADMFTTEKASSSTAATAAPSAAAAPEFDSADDSVVAESAEAPVAGLVGPDTDSQEPEPPSLMMEAPTNALIPDVDEAASVAGSLDQDSSLQQAQRDSISPVDSSEAELAYAEDTAFEPASSNDGISLPLWQLQAALAALAIAAIGAWAGLRRAHGG